MKSCRDCHLLPGCGWCDDGSGTGVGSCMPGGNDGPFLPARNVNSTATCSLFNPQTCSKSRWNFIDCPGNFARDYLLMPYLHQRLNVLADQTVAASVFFTYYKFAKLKVQVKAYLTNKNEATRYSWTVTINAVLGTTMRTGCPGSLLLLSQSLALQNIG